MEQSVALIRFRRSDLCIENTLHNNSFIPIGVIWVDMDIRLCCKVSG
jgi:hypothetical protein